MVYTYAVLFSIHVVVLVFFLANSCERLCIICSTRSIFICCSKGFFIRFIMGRGHLTLKRNVQVWELSSVFHCLLQIV